MSEVDFEGPVSDRWLVPTLAYSLRNVAVASPALRSISTRGGRFLSGVDLPRRSPLGEPSGAGIDAALAPDEPVQGLGIRLVHRGVAHHSVSPPDAVAAKAVLQGLSLPPRIMVLLEGGSLVNDASGLVLYRLAVAAALTGTFDAGQAAVSFATLALGGVVAGIAFGWFVTIVLGRLRDPTLSVIASFLAAWAAYIGGDALHVSGVLATVACGLVMGWRQHTVLSAATRTQAFAVWRVAGFILESLIFILIGLSLRGVVQRLGGSWEAIGLLMPTASAIILTVTLTRFIWIFPATYIPRFVIPPSRSLSAHFGTNRDELGGNAGRGQPGGGLGPARGISGPRFHRRHDLCRHSGDRAGAGSDLGCRVGPYMLSDGWCALA
jgi:hypothetical protein